MDSASGEREVDGVMADDVAHEAAARAQIEQRLQGIFRLAGDGDPARQLMRMILDYRCRQGQ